MSSISSPNADLTIVFDAVGTLIYARPAVAEVYLDVAASLGWSGSLSDIEGRFRSAFARMSDRAEDFVTDEAIQLQRWRSLVGRVFEELPASRVDLIFEKLWIHFAEPTAWEIFPDALAALELCRDRNVRWCIGSNFDSRLHRVLAGHPEFAECQQVFCSSEVGFDKPAAEFFRGIEQALGQSRERFVMVGDDLRLDAVAAEQAGWIGLWLNRGESGSASTELDVPPLLRSLEELEPWLM
jgi:putative hydrolase of the HAD superfamily